MNSALAVILRYRCRNCGRRIRPRHDEYLRYDETLPASRIVRAMDRAREWIALKVGKGPPVYVADFVARIRTEAPIWGVDLSKGSHIELICPACVEKAKEAKTDGCACGH